MDLYGGQHWSVIRSLPADGREAGLEVQLWVASAGYGLWNCNWSAHAYSATFTGKSEDAVAPAGKSGQAERQAWWEALSQGEHRPKKTPRSLAELVENNRNAVLMIVAPSTYVDAMEPDLVRASQLGHSQQKLFVISSDSPLQTGPLGAHWIKCPGALVFALGGGVASLYARVARHVLLEARRTGLELSAVRERVAELSRKTGGWPENLRSPVTDGEVLQFIRNELEENPRQSRSGLLQRFRNSGQKCQMERFNRLYDTQRKAP
ncbi:hypothetical protein [Hyalangium minutum]|uniref:TgtA5 cluster protein 2 n=1 Tax=Hyalangium minutum TaxID=394096 RepID=A0A085WRD3_9BACT|nr:hypothetical protein [Hyalangium minutum]KFE70246.1 tgtA5 cluster protein 2 [Hyalangium minutum]